MNFAALQHSVFLQALGSAILNSLWQCFILWLIYETISVAYKSASAKFKNNLGTLLLFFSFAWFLASFVSRIFNQQHVASVTAIPAGFAFEPHTGIHTVSGFRIFLSYATASLPYLSVAYIFLLFFLVAKLFAAYRYVYFISNRRLIHPASDLQFFASKVAREIGITKKIGVWISHHIDVPATIGFIKPVILIPLASINNLSCHQLEAIILHELAHIKRNDYITNLIISVIETLLFFNPFVVLLSNVIKRERENCCDDFVLQYRYDPHTYASALLRLEQSRMSKLKLAIGAVSGKKQLLSRIKRITNSQVVSRQFNYGQKVIALLLVTAIICSVAWLAPEEKKPVQAKSFPKGTTRTAPHAKTKLTGKARQAEATVASRQNENVPPLPAVIAKHISPKNEPVTFPDPDIENQNLPEKNLLADDDDENKDNTNLFKAENNAEHTGVFNLSQPGFYFDAHDIKLPPGINIQNFPFQNMNLNIDLSKIDMAKLNENLKLAYKQINTLDWKKIQNEIRKSFPKMKLSNLSQKEQDALFNNSENEKTKVLISRINTIRAQQQCRQYNYKALIEQPKAIMEQYFKKEMLVRDSLRSAEVLSWNKDNNIKVQQAYRKMQRQYERNNTGDYYFNYSNTAPVDNYDEEEKAECDQKSSGKKAVQISIRRIQNRSHSGALVEKKPLQFSFNSDDQDTPKHENVITVEVND